MNKSESIAQLAEALSKAQGEMAGAKKDNANPFFKSKYADLASVWEACREPLRNYGLAVTQILETRDNQSQVICTTILMHSSGEWISGELAMTPVKNDPQGVGSCGTYARRYGLSAIVGIAPEDDDGNQASGKNAPTRTEQPIPIQRPATTLAPTQIPPALVEALVEKMEVPSTITGDQAKKLHIRFKESLGEEMKRNADTILYDWLRRQGYVNEKKEGTSMAIPAIKFAEVGKAAVAYAKALSREPAQNEEEAAV